MIRRRKKKKKKKSKEKKTNRQRHGYTEIHRPFLIGGQREAQTDRQTDAEEKIFST